MLSLYFVHYNFCRIHKKLKVTPALEAGLTDTLLGFDFMIDLIDAKESKPKKRGPYKKTNFKLRHYQNWRSPVRWKIHVIDKNSLFSLQISNKCWSFNLIACDILSNARFEIVGPVHIVPR